jgi:hypothetical protein
MIMERAFKILFFLGYLFVLVSAIVLWAVEQ